MHRVTIQYDVPQDPEAFDQSPDGGRLYISNEETAELSVLDLTIGKVVRRVAEEGKVAIRNVRRDVMQHLKELVVNGDVGDDEERRAEQQVQKITDDHTKSIDDLLKVKETEIMEV